MSRLPRAVVYACLLSCYLVNAAQLGAQSFGVELHNTLMPASGGMGGVSIAQPQDVLSAINGNPATISQFRGTQFSFGGAYAEGTYNMSHTGNGLLPGISPFSAKSGTPGSALGNIGVTQDLTALGMPATFGVGLISTAGLGVDFAGVQGSGNAAVTLQVLSMNAGLGVDLTDQLSMGAAFTLGIGLFDGLFIGSSKATPDYGVRGTFGLNYDVDSCTSIGGYYQTAESFSFDNAIVLQPFAGQPGLPLDVPMQLPQNIGLGVSNKALMNGRLLLAADVLYKFWEDATLFDVIYGNQLVVQLGAQYSAGRAKLRLGYAWAEDNMVDVPGNVIAGIIPPGAGRALQFMQAEAANINQHRVTFGIGVADVLPGVDMDLFGGGMFEAFQQFGESAASVESYFLGTGLTWRFGRGSGCTGLAPERWCSN